MVRLFVPGELIESPEWIPTRILAEGECPRCGYEGPHPTRENEDGDMQGQCQSCYAIFTVVSEEEKNEVPTEVPGA